MTQYLKSGRKIRSGQGKSNRKNDLYDIKRMRHSLIQSQETAVTMLFLEAEKPIKT